MKLASVLTALAAVAQLCASARSPTMAAYSETRSFRDALDGRSMEDAISGPVDRDTSSYGERSGSPPLPATPANGNLATGDSGVAAAAGTAGSEDDVESTSAEPPAPVNEQLEREARVMRQPQSERQQQITAPQAPASPKAAQRREEFANNDQQQQQQYMQQPQAQMHQISADFNRPRASVRQQQQLRIAQQSGRTMRMAAQRKPTKMSPAQVNAMLNKMLGGGRMSAANAKLLSGMMKEMQKETNASAARRYQYRRLMMAAAMMQQRVADTSRDYSETTPPAYGNQGDDSSANYAPENQQQLQQQMQMLQQKQYQQDDGQQQQQAKQDSNLSTANEDGQQQQVQQQQRQSGYGQPPTSVGSDEQDGNNASGGLDNDSNMLESLGKPGVDFPVFSTPPETGFSCADQQSPGYYADVDAKCQAFYACQPDGRQDAFLCPNGTLFNQKFFVCDYYYHVDCNEAAQFYKLNANLYKSQPPSSSGAASYNNGQQTTTPEAGSGSFDNQESQDGADYQPQSEQQQQGYSTAPVSLPMPIPTPVMPTMPMMRSSPTNTGYAMQPKQQQQQPAQMQVQVPTNQMNQMRMQPTSPQEEEHVLAEQKQSEYGSYKNGQQQVSPSPQMPIQMKIQMVPMNQMEAQVPNANPVSYRSVGQMQTMRKMAPEMQQHAYGAAMNDNNNNNNKQRKQTQAMQMNAASPESGDSGYNSEDSRQQQQQQMDYDRSAEQQQQSERQQQVQEKQQNGRMNRVASRSVGTSAGRYTPSRANNQQQQYMALRMRGQKGIMRAGYDAQMQRNKNINNHQQQQTTASPNYIGNGKPMQMMQLMEPTAVPKQVQMGAQWPIPVQATTPSTTTSTNYERDPDAGFTNAKAAAS